MEATMRTDMIGPKAQNLIATDRVEGTPVRSSEGFSIGTIRRLMIERLTGNVAYAVLSADGVAGMARKHLAVPWARLTYDRKLKAYRLDRIGSKFGGPSPDTSNRDVDQAKRGRQCYWGIAEIW